MTKTTITAIDVIFAEKECYFCHERHFIPYVRYLVDENGNRVEDDYNNYKQDKFDIPNLQFGNEFLDIVKDYIGKHPEKGIIMGEVKERYSRTRDEWYMSYGCPKCDGIVGSFYLTEIEIDYMYETDENLMNRIQLKKPFEAPMNKWYVKD